MRRVRCAIYTRKSSEEGLDQEFNSLDAQREACEAYVASQKHEGWVVLPDRYDDGGVSGGTLERSGLRRLLKAIDEGLVDQIIVYKIDRLTRSLMDFSRLIERLDAAKASFVSVTQSFNTATSMGRLTLNVLLSFAQFEREVTAERIRDKIAASKVKGMWMGGPVPLGYQPIDRKLVVNEEEARDVKTIFDLYLEHRTVRKLKQACDEQGIISRSWTTKTGEARGGKPYSPGNLYRILTNPVYVGKVRHKKLVHEGLHQGIIESDKWDLVQAILMDHTARQRSGADNKPDNSRVEPSPLAGKVFDETGDRLTPSHTNKKGRRYRYYVSNRLIRQSSDRPTIGGWRLPARQLETAVTAIVLDWLGSPRSLDLLVQSQQGSATGRIEDIQNLRLALSGIKSSLEKAPNTISALTAYVTRITLLNHEIIIELDRPRLLQKATGKSLGSVDNQNDEQDKLIIRSPFQHRKRGVESRLILNENKSSRVDWLLLENVATARRWLCEIQAGRSHQEIAIENNRTIRQIQRYLEMAFLSSRIVQMIAEGTQPPELTTRRLLTTPIPMDWDQQHRLFGIR